MNIINTIRNKIRSIKALGVIATVSACMMLTPVNVQAGITGSKDQIIKITQNDYSLIPGNIRTAFEASGMTIRYVSNDELLAQLAADGVAVSSDTKYTGVSRSYSTGGGEILINYEFTASNSTIAHEIGHWVDNTGNYSGSSEWQEIFNEEGRRFTAYGANSKEEFFAEICGAVFTGKITPSCPRAYAYVKNVADTFNVNGSYAQGVTNRQTSMIDSIIWTVREYPGILIPVILLLMIPDIIGFVKKVKK